jgi:hypothetical protein
VADPQHENFWFEPIYVKAIFHREMVNNNVSANNYGPYKLTLFENYAKAKEKARLKKEQVAKGKEEANKKADEFTKKHGVDVWLSWDKLVANPFAYEGKTVGLWADFAEMRTASEGIFHWGSNAIVVSKIPNGMFTNTARVILAGKVQGKTDVKLPMAGIVSVPLLKFVGAHICKDRKCSDISGD